MNPVSITTLAKLFKISGALLGGPSIAVLALYAMLRWRRHLAGAIPETNFGDNPDAILLMLRGLTHVVGGIGNVIGAIAQWVLDMAAVASGGCLALAVVLWFTGSGLQAHASWARLSGFALLTLALLAALVLALSLRGSGSVVVLALAAFMVLGLHGLWAGAHEAPHL